MSKWYVVCDDYEAGPFRSREIAEAHLKGIERLAACQKPHAIREMT